MRFFEWFLNLTLSWRLLISGAMIYLGGPAFIGFLSEYATYYYALKSGVRPPVEGIPYLSATVTLASLFMVVTVSIVFYLTRIIVRYFIGNMILSISGYLHAPSLILKSLKKLFSFENKSLDKTTEKISEATNLIKHASFKQVATTCLIMGSLTFTATYLLISDEKDNPIWFAVFACTYSSALLFSLWREWVMKFIAFIGVVLFYIFSISLLFNQSHYSNFLQITGFGGGQVILIKLKEEPELIEMKLILRSKEWFIGFSPDDKNIEIPNESVEKITYERNISAYTNKLL